MEEGQKTRGGDDLVPYKQESLAKLTGTIFSTSLEKQGSFTQTAMTANDDNQEEDNKSNILKLFLSKKSPCFCDKHLILDKVLTLLSLGN